jgi:hypothetical protein
MMAGNTWYNKNKDKIKMKAAVAAVPYPIKQI